MVKFTIGRERVNVERGEVSEIARLINQSLEMDKFRDHGAYAAAAAVAYQRDPNTAPPPPPPPPPSHSASNSSASSFPAPPVTSALPPFQPLVPPPVVTRQVDVQAVVATASVASATCESMASAAEQLAREVEKGRQEAIAERSAEIEALRAQLARSDAADELLRAEVAELSKRCSELASSEQASANELNNFKTRIQQMCEQYAELDKKFAESLSRIKTYEQRYIFTKLVDFVKYEK
jgi:hypothetical protein